METRVAVISIIVENPEATEQLNQYLHESGKYIIGRMGIPYRQKGIHIISIAIDAPREIKIYRGELYRAIVEENKRAVTVPTDIDLHDLPKR